MIVSHRKQSIICISLVAVAWFGNALYAVGTPDGLLKYWSPALVAGAMLTFLFYHGSRAEGRHAVFTFVITIFLIGWSFETISIHTGFPFGHYHYTSVMGPFLGHVPVSVMPAYCVMGYISWATARVIVSRTRQDSGSIMRFGVPVVAAALMVMWDASMDPLRATVEARWVWRDGGPHFGVPLLNFAGWFMVTFLMFQAYALLRDRLPKNERSAVISDNFWMAAPLMYLAFPVEYLLNPLVTAGAGQNVSVNGVLVPVKVVHTDIALLTGATMVPVALLAIAQLLRIRRAAEPGRDEIGLTVGHATNAGRSNQLSRRPFSK
ncbi:MAG: carotenoid biosynthesis protein [Alphaproteobacteria bacterium]|nr:carotenoid biosynthesis protein [Alphaproteobacteria bacterium]